MANQPQNKRYKELLDELQLQSWQLELVISGFAIFGLFSALEPLFDLVINSILNEFFALKYLGFAVYFSCILTIVNLIIHVLLRGLWIGAVGIRSVSGDIEFFKLGFKPHFTDYFIKKIGSFDHFIERLERYSSVMFGLTFILVFMTIGVFINFVLFLFITGLIFDSGYSGTLKYIIGIPVFLIFILLYLLLIIDLFTRGFIKKSIGKWYLPIYRFTSFLTLSVFYRPLLYNLWDNEFGKRLTRWLIPIYLIGITVFSSDYISTNFFSSYYDSTPQFASRRNYWDMIEKKSDYIGYAAIPSKTIKTDYLEVSMAYESYLEEMVFDYDASLIPEKSRIGWKPFLYSVFHWEWNHSIDKNDETEFLNVINTCFITKVDASISSEKFVVSMEKNDKPYLKKYIDISNLKRGKHLLTIQRRTSKTDSTKLVHYETIPFWYFPD